MSSAINWPVTVVPIFAPIITPTAWYKFIKPALTKPTTITVVAEELCITAVTPKPTNIPNIRFVVNFSKIFCNCDPATSSRPSPIIFIPYKNSANPPSNVIKSVILIRMPS